jgi:hypothetical protein
VKKRTFPIPQNAIDGASNLPGYLKQNEGFNIGYQDKNKEAILNGIASLFLYNLIIYSF